MSNKTRLPAEWETQEAVWLAFPHNKKNWYGEREQKVKQFYYDLILKITNFETVHLLVPPHFEFPKEIAIKLEKRKFKVRCFSIPTNDIWIRDYGPFFLKREYAQECVKKSKTLNANPQNTENLSSTEIFKTAFNAWGNKFPPFQRDNAVPKKIAQKFKIPFSESPFIFEGGAIECNGKGLAITTAPCLYGINRNKKSELKAGLNALKKNFGLTDILILEQGLNGDHTDGHIDNVARFVSKSHVVIASETDSTSPNFERLQKAAATIKTWLTKHYGNKARVDTLVLPPQKKVGEEILPASYMNFIFVNGALIFPKYYAPTDKIAAAYFQSVFPDRKIIGVDAQTVIAEGGSLHCLTKNQ